MKTCPSCAYKSEDAALKCGICGGDISALKREAAPRAARKKTNFDLGFLFLLLLAAGLYFGSRRGVPPAGRAASGPAAKSFSNDGVVYTLDKMSALQFPGAEEKAAVLAAFGNADWKVRAAGAKTAGAWLRAGIPDIPRQRVELIMALRDVSGPVKKEAAMETGLLIGLGVMNGTDVPELEKQVRSFMEDSDAIVKSAGYFLAAMSGLSGLRGKLEHAFKYEPLPMTRLYAACALAGLGSEDGAQAVFRAAGDPDPEVRKEAALCLSYAATPKAVPLLRKISAEDADPETADNARFSLNLRKQLAIINNKPG